METTDYSGLFIYKNDHLEYILTPEGRLKWDDHVNQFYAEYFIKDHLGNVRSVITSDPNQHYIVQGTDYYPFGLEIPVSSLSDNKIKYNSKELQTDAGLNWYDYGARFYDPVLGRWHSVDPMYDRHYDWSPYVYVLNNPLALIDLNGYTDWPTIVKGAATLVGGLGATIGGVAAASTPTGVGQIGGVILISTGVPAMGLGIGQIVDGIVNDGSTDLPSGIMESTLKAVDATVGNGETNLGDIGAVMDIGISLVGGLPSTAVEQVALGVEVISTANDLIGSNDNNGTNTSESVDQTENFTVSDNTNVAKIPVPVIDINNVQINNALIEVYFAK